MGVGCPAECRIRKLATRRSGRPVLPQLRGSPAGMAQRLAASGSQEPVTPAYICKNRSSVALQPLETAAVEWHLAGAFCASQIGSHVEAAQYRRPASAGRRWRNYFASGLFWPGGGRPSKHGLYETRCRRPILPPNPIDIRKKAVLLSRIVDRGRMVPCLT